MYQGIAEPIQFRSEWRDREEAVRDQLIQIRDAQIAYKSIVGKYAPTFDTLEQVLRTEKFVIKSLSGDPEVDENVVEIITELSALDSMTTLGINLDSLRFVPYTNGIVFDMESKVLEEYQSAKNIPVIKVTANVKDYMGKWATPKYSKYDGNYDPKRGKLFFGDLNKPSTNGNWRQ
ncbi:MAG: hypothetical protein ACPG19_06160 [Saprospiraceae bacterium]